jgi:hypothetical protein
VSEDAFVAAVVGGLIGGLCAAGIVLGTVWALTAKWAMLGPDERQFNPPADEPPEPVTCWGCGAKVGRTEPVCEHCGAVVAPF